ncbi:MAG: sulfite exporter TauE/SafE family protein [Marmoricola sp.]
MVRAMGDDERQQEFLLTAIGCALLFTAATYALRMYLQLRHVTAGNEVIEADPQVKLIPTLLVGAVGGLLVGITSVGSGSLIMVALLLIYPTLSAVKLVGTDLLQAVPLVFAAAVGHVVAQGIDWAVLIPLIWGYAGHLPGGPDGRLGVAVSDPAGGL